MSNRHQLFEQPTLPKQFPHPEETSIAFWQDNDSGTWRLFLHPSLECVDLSLAQLRELATNLNEVVAGVDSDEWKNAEFVQKAYAKVYEEWASELIKES